MLLERIKGSIVAGAIGDALGYTVEFDSYDKIIKKFGKQGITRLQTHQSWLRDEYQTGKAVVSDDTQMTLFTAYGLLDAKNHGSDLVEGIKNSYLDWYCTQSGAKFLHDNWLALMPALNERRAPGMTCMSALEYMYHGMNAENNSKGCGGVMRIAPIPLFAAGTGELSIAHNDMLAAQASRITHKHPLGYIPSAVAAHIIYRLTLDENPGRCGFESYVAEAVSQALTLFPEHTKYVKQLGELLEKAIDMAKSNMPDVDCINSLGEGWVGDEALAIAVYCSLRHFDNIEQAIIAAVNHNGDSDSTGAIAGNILGAALGYESLPGHFLADVEFHDLLVHFAQCLASGELIKFNY